MAEDRSKIRQLELEIEALRGLLTRVQVEEASRLADARWVTEMIHGRPWHIVELDELDRRQWEERRKLVDELAPVALGLAADPWDRRKRLDAWERLLRISDDYRPGYLDYCREINVKPRL